MRTSYLISLPLKGKNTRATPTLPPSPVALQLTRKQSLELLVAFKDYPQPGRGISSLERSQAEVTSSPAQRPWASWSVGPFPGAGAGVGGDDHSQTAQATSPKAAAQLGDPEVWPVSLAWGTESKKVLQSTQPNASPGVASTVE